MVILVVLLAGLADGSTVSSGVTFASCRGVMIGLTTEKEQVASWYHPRNTHL